MQTLAPALASGNPDDPPMIAGQLLIYDLDETPPSQANNLLENSDLGKFSFFYIFKKNLFTH